MSKSYTLTVGASRLIDEMTARGWRDADLAREIECGQPQVCRLRTGARTPSLKAAIRLEKLLGIAPSDWLKPINYKEAA